MNKATAFPVTLDLSEPLPESLDLGARFHVSVAIDTVSGCDLTGAAYEVFQGDARVGGGLIPAITRRDPEADDYDPRNGPVDFRDIARIELTAPREIGAFEWSLVVPAHIIDGVAHREATLKFAVKTAVHRTSLAVWDVRSPVVAGETFAVIVGAKCTAACCLRAQRIELRDASGGVIATAALGDTPWPGTGGLYWTKMDAVAPSAEGIAEWTAAFAAADLGLPHQGASASLSFMTVAPGQHSVRVAIVEKETLAPVADAQVRLGFHRAATDATGVARFVVAPGEHGLFVWQANYAIPEQTIEVASDLELCVEAERLPDEDPYSRWRG